ncbi:hypothetical protein HY008_00530 [Candidatus Woesebacteria bacterium]|nr:hypothetical protein [Candidatus Woesebacteria bacterium]
MTLIVALEGKDGLALAADSRGTFGDPRGVTAQNDSVKKLYRVSNYVGILVAGAGELAVSLMDDVEKIINSEGLTGATQIYEKFIEIARAKYSNWFKDFTIQPVQGSEKPARPGIAAIIAGYNLDDDGKPSEKKVYKLHSLLDFAPQRSNYGFAVDGIAQYALYLFNRFYTKDRGVDELMHLATYSITETATQDGKVGGPVQAMVITDVSGTRELTKGEIDKIIASNERRSTRLRNSFFAPQARNDSTQNKATRRKKGAK